MRVRNSVHLIRNNEEEDGTGDSYRLEEYITVASNLRLKNSHRHRGVVLVRQGFLEQRD